MATHLFRLLWTTCRAHQNASTSSLATSPEAPSWLDAHPQPTPRAMARRPFQAGILAPEVKPAEVNDLMLFMASLPNRTPPAFIVGTAFFGQQAPIRGHKCWPLCMWNCCLVGGLSLTWFVCLLGVFLAALCYPWDHDFPF